MIRARQLADDAAIRSLNETAFGGTSGATPMISGKQIRPSPTPRMLRKSDSLWGSYIGLLLSPFTLCYDSARFAPSCPQGK